MSSSRFPPAFMASVTLPPRTEPHDAVAYARPSVVDAARTPMTATAALRARLLMSTQLDALPTPTPVLEGVLDRDSLVELYGKPGCGKSFLALDWALSVASGRPWQGQAAHSGPVLYVVGEGIGGMARRRRAWEAARNCEISDNMRWLRGAVPLLDRSWLRALTAVVAEMRPVLVVVDTVSRAIPGHNENAPETMSGLVEAFDRLRDASNGACVLAVHHATKDGHTNRGHSALEGACDVRWKLTKQGGQLTLTNPKTKDDAESPARSLHLKVVDLSGTHESGASVTSCVVESHAGVVLRGVRPASEEHLLAVMRDCFGTTGVAAKKLKEVTGLSPSTHYRALRALTDSGDLLKQGRLITMPARSGS